MRVYAVLKKLDRDILSGCCTLYIYKLPTPLAPPSPPNPTPISLLNPITRLPPLQI